MQYTRLGKSDLLVSRICMGCMGFGDPSTGQHSWTLDETASRDIIRYGLEKGINFYDTAIAYQNGSSERYVGRALREMAKRDDIVLATKFLPRTPAQIAGGISGKEAIAQSLDQSLKNLGMDYIDLYIYHIWDYNTPIIDVLEALHTAVTAGKVRAVGISNCYAWQLAKANALAEREGLTPFVSVQSHYNLIMREDERELFGLCTEDNIAMTPISVDADGRLTAKKAGTVKITATIGKKTYTYPYTVIARSQKNVLDIIWNHYVTSGMSDYEKAVAAQQWMQQNVSPNGTSVLAQKALEQGKANYKGFCEAYQLIMKHYGISAKVVNGKKHNKKTN